MNPMQNILQKLTKKYGNEAFNIITDYGSDISSKGMDSLLGKLANNKIKQSDLAPDMVVGHALTPESLGFAEKWTDGKLVNPSLQATPLDKNMPSIKDFGDIFLQGSKELVNPETKNLNFYARDGWTARFPRVMKSPDGTGLYGADRKPISIDEISKIMRDTTNERSFAKEGFVDWGNDSALVAMINKRYKTLQEVIRDNNLAENTSGWGARPKQWGENSEKLRSIIEKRRKDVDIKSAEDYLMKANGDKNKALRMYERDLLSGVMDDLMEVPSLGEIADHELRELYGNILESPTFYKEAKYLEPLALSEFQKAYVPVYKNPKYSNYGQYKTLKEEQEAIKKLRELEDFLVMDNDVAQSLLKNNIEIIPYYGYERRLPSNNPAKLGSVTPRFTDVPNTMQEAINREMKGMNRFNSPYLLGSAGVVGGAGILNALLGGGGVQEYY